MNKDLLAALRRIRMVAQYGLEERESRAEMVSTLTYIIEEAGEALDTTKALHALLEEQ
jgi:NTP pyrophosphatase (non-canonical NTP hydrolase)